MSHHYFFSSFSCLSCVSSPGSFLRTTNLMFTTTCSSASTVVDRVSFFRRSVLRALWCGFQRRATSPFSLALLSASNFIGLADGTLRVEWLVDVLLDLREQMMIIRSVLDPFRATQPVQARPFLSTVDTHLQRLQTVCVCVWQLLMRWFCDTCRFLLVGTIFLNSVIHSSRDSSVSGAVST